MKRKWLAIGIILLFIGTYSIPAVAHPKDDIQPQGIISNLMFVMHIWWGNETQEPISPGETREVNLTISYVVLRGLYGRLLLQFLKGKLFPLQISIENKPDWCEAWIDPTNMTGIVSKEIGFLYPSLFIHLNDDAPSNYTMGWVKMHGTIKAMKGLFNVLTLIHGYEQNFIITFITGP